MKETINVNIAQQAFTMDVDAYSALTTYLDDIGRRLPEGDTETLADIETRIAEIFRERVPSPMMVITYGIVRNTMNQIGSPENFGYASRPLNEQTHQQNTNRLYRSRKDRSIAGICSGIAKYFGLDTTLVRIAAILCIFFAGATLWIYLILWLVLPYEPEA
jgi:phage shock protein PspC (stress-responsive transcriptional regulator)